MACAAHVDVEVSPTYYGASEEAWLLDNAELAVSHASAVEIARDHERNAVFAVGWIDGPPLRMKVWLYDYQSQSFTTPTPITLPYSPRGRVWVARAGYDPFCEVTGLTESSCAWFSWTAWGNVNWVAVDRDGQTAITAWPGFDGSGDIGVIGTTRRQLRAWISIDRSQVLAQLFQGTTPVSEVVVVRTVQGEFAAYQTAVAWSERHQRWLVTWAENNLPRVLNGKVQARWVAFDGSMGPSTQHVAYCEGSPYDTNCGIPFVPATASSGISKPDVGVDPDGGQRVNACICKGLFLAAASEQYVMTPDADAFRVHQYGWQARLAPNGHPEDIYCASGCNDDLSVHCSTFCPLDRLPPTPRGEGIAAYQMAGYVQEQPSEMVYLQVGDHYATTEGAIHHVGDNTYPQAVRTATYVSASLATDQSLLSHPASLRLTISDAGQGSCP